MTETKKYLAVVLVRGLVCTDKDVKDTLKMMNLQKKFSCTIIPDNSVNRGMVQKCKDMITYGEVSEETIKELDSKREKRNNHYALPPPRGGFERNGTKKPYTTHGALGYRGDKINDLLKKMM